MDLLHYFNPVDFEKLETNGWINKRNSLGLLLQKNALKLKPEKAELIIFGVEECRNSIEAGAEKAPDEIRKYLYALNRISPRIKVLDIGNLKIGKTITDTYFALRDIGEFCIEKKQTILILGGSQDLTFGITKAFEGRAFNLVTVDPKLDYQKGIKTINSENYLNLIFEKQPNLFSYTALAYQNYFVDGTELDQYNQMNWETKRLGQIRYDLKSVEPILRNANVFGFDFNAIRYQDGPGQSFASPNGLYAEEACQLSRYAGASDELNVAGFFNLIPEKDSTACSSKLMAQIVWHFIEGFVYRKPEDPSEDSEDITQFVVDLSDVNTSIAFLQSRRTGRWWMEIQGAEMGSKSIIPCSETDYVQASQGEIPDRWWKNIRKTVRKQNK